MLCPVRGAAPLLLNFQGRIIVGNAVFEGNGQFKFALVNANGSVTYWMNSTDADRNGEPDSAVSLPVSHGLYSVILGNTNLANMAPLPPAIFSNDDLRLRVWFNDRLHGFEILSPDQRLTSSAYAVVASTVDSLDASKISSGLIDTARIPSVDASKIASGTLVDGRLSQNVVLKNPDLLTLSNDFASRIVSGDAAVTTQISSLTAQVNALAGNNNGVIDPNRIPALDASKISSGVFAPARIPLLPPSQIAVLGEFSPNLIPALDASKIESGILSSQRIPPLDASKMTSGTIDPARLPAGLVYTSDLLATSNALSDRLIASNAVVSSALAGLSAQLADVANHLATVSNQVTALVLNSGVVPGTTLVSSSPSDSSLTSQGYAQFYTAPAPAWHTSASAGAPSPRYLHSSVWTGSKWMIWGGLVGGGLDSQQGAEYDANQDKWNAISTVNAPSSRSGHTAVWTGTEMIVWGGFSSGSYLKTGGRISAGGASWSSIQPLNSPDEREGHVAVWCNGKMLIWGGRNSTGILNSGALYDPVGNSWTALNLPNAPEARFRASAVWTGDRVLIWGGNGSSGAVGTGAQLLFSAGNPTSWQSISAANAPTARNGQSAIWTGSRFVVWGGENNGSLLNSGGSYDPISNSWQSLSATGAPGARKNHATAWTGTEMLIFGGENGSGTLTDGAAFNPALNSWRALSSAGSPQACTEASAAWSGAEFMVFGGRNGPSPIGSLQRLDPQPTWYFYRKQ